jgi:crotonobetainyl-CoA:carnitine CoA-transferase CaiB-like acyl-CoA transferase
MNPDRLATIVAAGRLERPDGVPVTIEGSDPVFDSPFPVGEVAATALGLAGAAAADYHRRRTGTSQSVTVRVQEAGRSLISLELLRADGRPLPRPDKQNDTIGFYQCAGDRWFYLMGAFPGQRQAILDVLQCAPDRDSIAAAVARWDADELEDALAANDGCGARVRTLGQWRASPQGALVAAKPTVEVLSIGDAPPAKLSPGRQPLEAIRVLDVSRVLAGPTAAQILAQQGAETLVVSAPHLPYYEGCVIDTGHGKRACHLDLDDAADAERMRSLIRDADVVIDGYRSDSLAARGFGPEDLAALRPGLVVVSINCFGHDGPWRRRPGWEQIAEAATGIMAMQGTVERPQPLPAAFNDYVTGYLGAFGALLALSKQASEGGTWWVRASLCQTAQWLQNVGPHGDWKHTPAGVSGPLARRPTPFGLLEYLRPAIRMSVTPPVHRSGPVPLGSHRAQWAGEG